MSQTPSITVVVTSLALSLAAGCSGHAIDVGENATTNHQPVSPTPTAPSTREHFTAAEVSAAKAQCNAPHGQADVYGSVAELKERLVGAWYICVVPDWVDAGQVGPISSERFTADGHLYVLVDDGEGGLIDGVDLMSVGTYAITNPSDAEYNNNSYELIVHWADGYSAGPYAYFETAPRRMKEDDAWFVPLTHS